MKNKLILTSLLLLAAILEGFADSSISFQTKTSLYKHMTEVNVQWNNYSELLLESGIDIDFSSENERIQKHLELVEKFLKRKDVSHLSVHKQERRKKLLLHLNSYWREAKFPENIFHKNRQPYFIDYQNTTCAVAHLLRKDEQHNLIGRIIEKNNFDYILDMPFPEIEKWAIQNGFSLDELALIQPGYPQTWHYEMKPLGDNSGCFGAILSICADDNLLYVAGDFIEMDGTATGSIIAWDEEEWLELDQGVCGRINDMIINSNGELIIAGEFEICNGNVNSGIAKWDGIRWSSLGDVEGKINSIVETDEGNILVGGLFVKVNSLQTENLALYNPALEEWNNNGKLNSVDTEAYLSANGEINDMILVEDKVILAGNFTSLGSLANVDIEDQITSKNLVYWYQDSWLIFENELNEINCLWFDDNKLFVGGDLRSENTFGYFENGNWNDLNEVFYGSPNYVQFGNNTVEGFFNFDQRKIAFGGVGARVWNQSPERLAGLLQIFFEYEGADALEVSFDNTIRAFAKFKGSFYFAGDFKNIDNNEVLNIVRTDFVVPNQNVETLNGVEVYYGRDQIHINTPENFKEELTLYLFDLFGKLLFNQKLDPNLSNHSIPINVQTSGMYVYSLNGSNGQIGGKIHIPRG